MRLSDITAVGRSLDPRYPTNLAIGALSLVCGAVGVAANLLSGANMLDSALWGIGAALAVFLSWALGRELDPDHDLSAFVGAGLMAVALLFYELPALMVILWLIVALRVVNRAVGLPARPLDSLALLGLGGWLTWQGHWIAGLMTAVTFLLDGLLARPLRYHLVLSGVAFAGTVVLSIFHGDMAMEGGPTIPVAISAAVMAALFLMVIATSREPRTVCDATRERLNPGRVRAAQILALLTALLYAWWEGIAGVEALSPLWAAMLGVVLYRLVSLIFVRNRDRT
ncbi:MAG: hypothetical protein ACK2UU_00365 [Anaerolineae bacterium]